jgi:hypothetical protein
MAAAVGRKSCVALLAVAAVAASAVIAAGCGSTKTVTETVTVSTTAKSGLGPPQERVEYGHIKSLARVGDHYALLFDPALLLSGVTANKAAAEDGAVEPGEPVPNDNYVVDEGHRAFTYIVPDGAKVTVLTNEGDPAQLGATPVTVAELASIVHGTSDVKLYEPLDTGVWITVDGDTVRSLDQQYRP